MGLSEALSVLKAECGLYDTAIRSPIPLFFRTAVFGAAARVYYTHAGSLSQAIRTTSGTRPMAPQMLIMSEEISL